MGRKIKQHYEIKNFTNKVMEREFFQNAYATFCVAVVDSMKDKMLFNKSITSIPINGIDTKVVKFEMEMPQLTISNKKLKHLDREKKDKKNKIAPVKKIKEVL